jgi:hypothetical protein
VIVTTLAIPRVLESNKKHYHWLHTYTTKKESKLFRFLLKSGKLRLNKGRISAAYSEFKSPSPLF